MIFSSESGRCEESPRSLAASISEVRRLDPDVETIVGKALEKDADRRYASAAALSEDLGRWLTSQPILARPPSTINQLRKFANHLACASRPLASRRNQR